MKKHENTQIVIDVTTFLNWVRPPVGIIRIQFEFIQYIFCNYKKVKYCKLTENKTVFVEVTKEEVQNHIEKIVPGWDKDSAIICNKTNFIKKLWSKFHKKNHKNISIECNQEDIDIGIPPKYLNKSMPDLDSILVIDNTLFTKKTVMISMGFDWQDSNYALIYCLKKKIGFEFVGVFHDLIAVSHPHFGSTADFSRNFIYYLYYLLHLSDRIFCNSNFSKKQLEKFSKEYHIGKLPELKAIHLGDNVINKIGKTRDFKKRNHSNDYILYVSTIEIRKNHILLLKVWQRLLQDKLKDLPDLVLVGMKGWGVDDVWELYESDSRLQQKVHFYHDVSDAELAGLYQQAKFTVFPSFIEGWGMASVESLLYGKMCVISDADALKEATQGLMPALDPNDTEAWAGMIKELSTNPTALKNYEELIKKEFKTRSWTSFSKDLTQFILSKR